MIWQIHSQFNALVRNLAVEVRCNSSRLLLCSLIAAEYCWDNQMSRKKKTQWAYFFHNRMLSGMYFDIISFIIINQKWYCFLIPISFNWNEIFKSMLVKFELRNYTTDRQLLCIISIDSINGLSLIWQPFISWSNTN